MKRLDHMEAIDLFLVVDLACYKDEEGFCVFRQGWSDEKILAEAQAKIPELNLGHVASLRERRYGELRTQPDQERMELAAQPDAVQNLGAQIGSLSQAVGGLDSRLVALEARGGQESANVRDALARVESSLNLVQAALKRLEKLANPNPQDLK